jgi:hypothetical protein
LLGSNAEEIGGTDRGASDSPQERESMEAKNPSRQDGPSSELLLDEAESLIWALLDDQIQDADLARLTKMLEERADVRARYIDCVQLHVDLREHFGRPADNSKQTPCVLGNLSTAFAAEGFPAVGQ